MQQIEDVYKRWPAHTPPPALMAQLDELEEELQMELMEHEDTARTAEFETQDFHLHAIGYVLNEYDEPSMLPKEPFESRLVIDPSLIEGFEGLEAGQQVMVIFFFHKSKGFSLLQHPHGDESLTKRGVFSLRSPRRPNPIGVTIVELLSIAENVLHVRGLDACNGTPVLDLKAE